MKLRLMLLGMYGWMVCSLLYSADYPVSGIPDSLRWNAHSVVRLYRLSCRHLSNLSAEYQYESVVSVLNEKGLSQAVFGSYEDNFSSIASFYGEIYDGEGKLIRKVKKRDLVETEYFAGLASDSRICYYACSDIRPPFTVKYQWTISVHRGVYRYPVFCPIRSWHQSLERADYELIVPSHTRIQAKLTGTRDSLQWQEGESRYMWHVAGWKAVYPEWQGRNLDEKTPALYAAPLHFNLDGFEGMQESWKSLGDWLYTLQRGRETLPEQVIGEIKSLTDTIADRKEKVKAVYRYLGNTTRYVSMQLGIGGLQPMSAAEVFHTKFSDCKGLSFYMKALLDAVGIPSIYTVISTENEKLFSDFPNLHQMNHAILCVPLQKDSLWLECTNTEVPFGYVHQDIAGHDALLVTDEEGGKLVTLPDNPDSLNISGNDIEVSWTEREDVQVQVKSMAGGECYEDWGGIGYLQGNELVDYIRRRIELPDVRLSELTVMNENASYPMKRWSYVLKGAYSSLVGSRIVIPLNPFRSVARVTVNKLREEPFKVKDGYCYHDKITLHLPVGYEVEHTPKDASYVCGMGEAFLHIKREGNVLALEQYMQIRKGCYPLADTEKVQQLMNTIFRIYTGKIVLKKKET